MALDKVLVVDMGSDYCTGCARELRNLGVYSELVNFDIDEKALAAKAPVAGLVYAAGPNRLEKGQKIEKSAALKALICPSIEKNFADEDDVKNTLADFIKKLDIKNPWSIKNFIAEKVKQLKAQIGNEKVILALSGGVDSSVVAAMLIKAIGNNLTAIHVNHGLLRAGESDQVVKVFKEKLGANLIYVDAVDRFLDKLSGVSNPEQKRKIIGAEFIDVFDEQAKKLSGIKFLAQGTIYPDIIESGTKTKKTVKSHHNVGGLPEKYDFKLIEPLDMLFKDEVRKCGLELGLPESMVYRQPFPGPGLGVRCTGAITRQRLEMVRASDKILREEFEKAGLSKVVWQYFTIVPDVKSVGIKDSARVDEYPCVIRAVNTVDAMTATIEELPYSLLNKLAARIPAEVDGINRVLYDITPKPTGTIEWE